MFSVLSNEPDFKEQMSWLSETVKFFSGCDIYLYVKRLHTLIYLSYIFFTVGVGVCDGLGSGAGQSRIIEKTVRTLTDCRDDYAELP